MNPVRANMVSHPAEYFWSSYNINALAVISKLCTPHLSYIALGKNEKERANAYRGLFDEVLEQGTIDDIRAATRRGLVGGSEKFKNEIEANLNYSVRPNPVGRPKKCG